MSGYEDADFPRIDPDPVGVARCVVSLQPRAPDGDSSGVHDLRLPLHVLE